MAVTVEAMAADMEVTGEATAATVITTESAMLKPLPLLSLATVMDMEDTVIMAVTAVMAMAVTDTAMASVMLSLATANEKCHSIVVSFTNVGRADRQNFVNIHSESLFLFTSLQILRLGNAYQYYYVVESYP